MAGPLTSGSRFDSFAALTYVLIGDAAVAREALTALCALNTLARVAGSSLARKSPRSTLQRTRMGAGGSGTIIPTDGVRLSQQASWSASQLLPSSCPFQLPARRQRTPSPPTASRC